MKSQATATAPAAGSDGGDFAALMARENDMLGARFSAEDIVNPARMAQRIVLQAEPIEGYLNRLLTRDEREHVNAIAGKPQEEASPAVLEVLARVLNEALQMEGLAERCGGATLPAGGGTDPVGQNRQFLQKAFAEELREEVPCERVIVSTAGHAGEPWVAFTSKDWVGLALSGGGVRSATFNLGLLQGLAGRGVLDRFHYLATVSGGGYIGGFWTRWRLTRRGREPGAEAGAQSFPQSAGPAGATSLDDGPGEIREPREIRHLREFSRFLIPRSGLNAEFWATLAAVLSGLVPALVATGAFVLGAMAIWAGAAGVFLDGRNPAWVTGAILAVVVGGWLLLAKARARAIDLVERGESAWRVYELHYCIWTMAALLLAGAAMWALLPPCGAAGAGNAGYTLLFDATESVAFLFRPSLALACTMGVLMILRLPMARTTRRKQEAPPRKGDLGGVPLAAAAWGGVQGQLLKMLVCWTVLAAFWVVAGKIRACDASSGGGAQDVGVLGAGTGAVTLLFYLARNWLQKPKEETRASGLMEKIQPLLRGAARFKSALVGVLANGIVALTLLLAALTLWRLLEGDWWLQLGLVVGGCAAILLVALWLFDPAAVGLHEFYRGRLARCFLGAGRVGMPPARANVPDFGDERAVVERAADDMRLYTDAGLPLHLICCAANQTTIDDQLATLHRGARSVVLSRFGIAWGDHWAAETTLRLSSALTASAAAFNSLMGERTLLWGRAVPFVMTALNLRLGLWVRNPVRRGEALRWSTPLRGWPFFRELFGSAQCSADSAGSAYLHLSDGGHFENLALYELIRRHCRYIVVADAGEDGRFTFDDFGRAARRVREDFGVEIEIDLTPLKPDDAGRSSQHLAAGVIHYDGVVGTDKGTLVYFKPTLTGDEPPDVLQYRCNHPEFPHEPTGDQFFDESQFESYRRLGEHIVSAGFGPLESQVADPALLADESIFWWLRQIWHQVPWMECADGIRLWESSLELEKELGERASGDMGRQYLGLGDVPEATVGEAACGAALFAIRVCKFLENVWVVCKLDSHWSDPRASNWMCILHRWAALPAVRDWWPAIRPLMGADFQTFAELQLHLPHSPKSGSSEAGTPTDDAVTVFRLADRRWPEVRDGVARSPKATARFDLILRLAPSGGGELQLQIGAAFVQETDGCAKWAIEDLFVVPEFAFGDYLGRLLDDLIEYYRRQGTVERLQVDLEQRSNHRELVRQRFLRNQASRRGQTDLIGFYRSRGFSYDAKAWSNGRCIGMILRLTRRSAREGAPREKTVSSVTRAAEGCGTSPGPRDAEAAMGDVPQMGANLRRPCALFLSKRTESFGGPAAP